MTRELKLILGPPGTGKTTTLLKIVEGHLKQGILPTRIAFVSFTRKAAHEAAQRAITKFKLSKSEFVYFRTLHSLAFQALDIQRDEVMGRTDYLEIAKLLGVEFTGYSNIADGIYTATEGDMMLQMVSLARARTKELRSVWEYINPSFDWYKLKQFASTIEEYKLDMGKLDFNDMITQYTGKRYYADIDVAIIDEAQDLSNAQWDMVKVAFRKAKHVYLAGDDDQAIYEWSGANIERFLQLDAKREILPITYRLPKEILSITEKIAKRIKHRYVKEYKPVDNRQGNIARTNDINSIDIVGTGGTWFLLARNAIYLKDYRQLCREQGIGYTDKKGSSVDHDHIAAIKAWVRLQKGDKISEAAHKLIHGLYESAIIHTELQWYDALVGIPPDDRQYYQSILRNGGKLDDCGKVYIGTIHSVKGGEADHVVIKQDVTWNTARGFDLNPSAEHRVFYVGASRAKESLYIVDSQSEEQYQI